MTLARPMLLAACFVLPLSAAAVDTGATHVPFDDEEDAPRSSPPAQRPAGDGLPFQEGTLGVSFTLGGSGMNHWGPTGGVGGIGQIPTVGVTWFMDPANALRIDVGLAVGLRPDFDLDLEVGLGYRLYFMGMAGRVAPYAQPGVVIGWLGEAIQIGLVGLFGVEYFFTDQLAIGGNLGVRFLLLNDVGRIGLVTATQGLHISFYW